MEVVLSEVKNLFSAYGLKAVIIIVLTVLIVNLIKKPIVKKFVAVVEKNGYDKSLVTKNFAYITFLVAIFLEFIAQIIISKFNFYILDFASVLSAGVLYGGLAIALYETVKAELKAYASKNNATNEKQID